MAQKPISASTNTLISSQSKDLLNLNRLFEPSPSLVSSQDFIVQKAAPGTEIGVSLNGGIYKPQAIKPAPQMQGGLEPQPILMRGRDKILAQVASSRANPTAVDIVKDSYSKNDLYQKR